MFALTAIGLIASGHSEDQKSLNRALSIMAEGRMS